MLIRQLHYLVALAEDRHFARAAERCNISQPALSLAIKHIESELKVAIVQRGPRFRGFTTEGDIVLAWARRLLRERAVMLEELHCSAGPLHGKLRLGVIPSGTALSGGLVSSFARKHPSVSFTSLEMSSAEIFRSLSTFAIDAGITYVDNEPIEHVRTTLIGYEEYVLVTSEPTLRDVPHITWVRAAELPLCLLNLDMQHRRIIEGVFERVGVRPIARIEVNSLTGSYCFLQLGWSTILPRSVVERLKPPDGMHVVNLIDPVITKAIGLVVADRDSPAPLLKAFRASVLDDRVGLQPLVADLSG